MSAFAAAWREQSPPLLVSKLRHPVSARFPPLPRLADRSACVLRERPAHCWLARSALSSAAASVAVKRWANPARGSEQPARAVLGWDRLACLRARAFAKAAAGSLDQFAAPAWAIRLAWLRAATVAPVPKERR